MDLSIRAAVAADAPALARLQVDNYREAYAGLLPADYLAAFSYAEQESDWRDYLAEANPSGLLLAELGGALAGYVLARVEPLEGTAYDGEIAALHVRPALRGRGIGRGLVAAAARALSRQGCRSLWLSVLAGNQPAIAFYRRLGGQPLGEKTFQVSADFSARELIFGWPDIAALC